MATAELIVPNPVPVTVVLTLTQYEAQILRAVCARIGGQYHTPRGTTSDIANALDSAGIKEIEVWCQGSIYFDDEYYSKARNA